MRITKVHLLALAFVAGVLPSVAAADGWFSRMGAPKDVTLAELLRNPREYVDVEVKVKVYFDAPGENYNPYFTRFNEETYGNFTAWPIDARLYDKRDFPRPYPFFFASKMDKTWKKMKNIDHLRVIELTGTVRDVFKGQPWIEVTDWSSASGGLSEDDVRDVVRADASFVAGKYKDAARLYERAYSSSLHPSVRADLQRRLGDAYFRSGEYGDAQDAYERGLRSAPDNAVLKQGAEAADTARKQAKAARRGETVEGGTPEIASPEQPVVGSNSTDEVIRLLEDPAKVQADVDAWRTELGQRAAALHGGTPGAVPVAGTETAEPAAETTTETVVEEEPVVAEGCAEATTPEGCATEPESVETPAGVREPMETGETPAEATEQPAETTTETPAETVTETPAETTAEQPAETVTETPAETTTEEPAETVAEPVQDSGASEGCAEQGTPEGAETSEGCAGTTEGSDTGEAACGEESSEGCAESAPVDETVAIAGDERVVWVSGQMLRLPRLPFFGCEDVTDDDLRAIIQDVVENPESDE